MCSTYVADMYEAMVVTNTRIYIPLQLQYAVHQHHINNNSNKYCDNAFPMIMLVLHHH